MFEHAQEEVELTMPDDLTRMSPEEQKDKASFLVIKSLLFI